MSEDERALLQAVIAAPADDAVRLVYADWLEENNQPARAEFIRVQVEAERHHPDSARRAQLDARAQELLKGHWIDWWAPVCEGVGLPPPQPARAGRLGWLGRVLGLGWPAGGPYTVVPPHFICAGAKASGPALKGFQGVMFRRGFPFKLEISCNRGSDPSGGFLSRWTEGFPLTELCLLSPNGTDCARIEGPHLRRLRALQLSGYRGNALAMMLASPNLDGLEDLTFTPAGEAYPRAADELFQVTSHPRADQLRRLAVLLWDERAATIIASAPGLAGLHTLEVDLQDPRMVPIDPLGPDVTAASEWVAILAESPRLAGLTELAVSGDIGSEGCRVVSSDPIWKGLRKLSLSAELFEDHLDALLTGADLPALEELRFGQIWFSRSVIDLFVRSPLLKQLRHLAFTAWGVDAESDADWRRLPEMFDLDRIETFAFDADHWMPGLDELERQLGDRLRVPWK